MDGAETGVLLSVFVQKLRHKNADVPCFYSSFFDAAGISPTLVQNRIAKAKERGNWVPFKKWTSKTSKTVHAGWCWLWICGQFSES